MTSGALTGFLAVWSDADATFGHGIPQTGEQFGAGAELRRLQADLQAADPGPSWTGPAAGAYGAVHTEHKRVLGALADLDEQLTSRVNESARIVTAGRAELQAVRQWVLAAAAAVPRTVVGEQMMLPIVQSGIGRVAAIVRQCTDDLNAIGRELERLGERYRMLGDQKFGNGPAPAITSAR